MFRAIATIGLREVQQGKDIYEFKQDFVVASLCGLGIGAIFWCPVLYIMSDPWFDISDWFGDAILLPLVILGTVCLTVGSFGLGHYKRIVLDRGAGTITVQTRSWWRKSEVHYPYGAASLELHKRRKNTGKFVMTDYVLMVRLPDREEILGSKGGRSTAEKLAAETAEKVHLPYCWSEETVTSLF